MTFNRKCLNMLHPETVILFCYYILYIQETSKFTAFLTHAQNAIYFVILYFCFQVNLS
jgi:hypothetical protein